MTVEVIAFFALLFVCICGAAALFYLFKNLLDDNKTLRSRAQDDQAFIRNELYNSTSKILREAARHRYGGKGNRH